MTRSQKSPAYHLQLLGAFRLERRHGNTRAVEIINLPTRKVQSLLAYLALFPEAHAREKLAALLWGDSSDRAARQSLRVALNALRKTLGDDAFVGDSFQVQLNPALMLEVDAREWKHEGGRMKDESRPMQLSSFILHVKRSESSFVLLPDFYDEWILQERERLRIQFLELASRVIADLRAASEYPQAIALAQRVLEIDRAHEAAHQHLMFLYVVTGKRAAALAQYNACERALRDELAVEPSAETRALVEWIRQTPSAHSLTGQITNLPIPLSSFVGRQTQVQRVKEMLRAPQTRALTLLGAGGSGKTRLAIQVGTELLGEYADGIWWIELAALNDSALVLQAIARALGVRETRGESLAETLLDFLRTRNALLLLDNCEHLIGACARVTDEILAHCAQVKILATSREALNVHGEAVYQVPTLGVPHTETVSLAALLLEFEAVRLFVERARGVNAQFALTEQNAFAVAQIVRQLDGIPLAIELAAARVNALTAEQIAARLDDRFALLSQGARTALPRQKTLRALIDWSYDLLNEAERALFRRLCIFAGGWTLDAAETICGEPTAKASAVLDLLTRLVDKSLVIFDGQDSDGRYRFLETIREYAAERLESEREAETVRARHFRYWVTYAAEREPNLWGAVQVEWVNRFERERDNFRAALAWGLNQDAAQVRHDTLALTIHLARFWVLHNHYAEGIAAYHAALAHASDAPLLQRARAVNRMGDLLWRSGQMDETVAAIEPNVNVLEMMDAPLELGDALHVLGTAMYVRGDLPRSNELLGRALTLRRAHGDLTRIAATLNNLGEVARLQKDYATARSAYREALDIARISHDSRVEAYILNNLGIASNAAGAFQDAQGYLKASIQLVAALGDKHVICYDLIELAHTATMRGEIAVAIQLYAAVETAGKEFTMGFYPEDSAIYDERLRELRARVAPQIFSAEWSSGSVLSLEQAVALALDAK